MYPSHSPAMSSFDDSSSVTDMKSEQPYENEYLDLDCQSVEEFLPSADQTVPEPYYPQTSYANYMNPGTFETPVSYQSTQPIIGADRMLGAGYSVPTSSHSQPLQTNYYLTNEQQITRTPVIVGTPNAQPPKPRRKGGRKPKNDPLPPHLAERRRLRRIRNKEAAQKCRERRLAYTDELLQQIAELEQNTLRTEQLIETLRQTKEQCEFILNSHRPHCNKINKRKHIHPTLNMTNCATEHRRSSSSTEELQSPIML